jgi:uncharacterized membrane protein
VVGLPITEAYWVNVQVGGVEQPVLFQAFEPRVLTYMPSNPLATQVEMSNVGQHYFAELVDAAFDQIRLCGRDNGAVMTHLLDAIGRISDAAAEPVRRVPLARQAQLVYQGSAGALPTDGDRATLEHHLREALARLNPIAQGQDGVRPVPEGTSGTAPLA